MESQPITIPFRKINLLKRILLYPQVSAFKVCKSMLPDSYYQRNYRARSASFTTVVSIELVAFIYFSLYLPSPCFQILIVVTGAYHILLDLIFYKTIAVMGFDYYSYYNKFLFYIFLAFLAIASIAAIITFYNSIGHLPK